MANMMHPLSEIEAKDRKYCLTAISLQMDFLVVVVMSGVAVIWKQSDGAVCHKLLGTGCLDLLCTTPAPEK